MTQRLGLGPERPPDEPQGYAADFLNWWAAGPLGWTIVPAGIAGFIFLFDWSGYQGKAYSRWGDPRPLADIWWHFPLQFAAVAIVIKLIYRSMED
jgi:hypothetical protein